MTLARPIVRYHGGKWMLAPWIMGFFPKHKIYVEPFGGGGSVLMRKTRSYAEVYNDLDGDMVAVFRTLRDPAKGEQLAKLLTLTPWAREEFYATYEPAEDEVERARRTIARCFMAFGTTSRRKNRTGFRAKAYRESTTGPQDWANYPDIVPAFVQRLQGVTIEHRDALEVIQQQDTPETLFYCDPPYPTSTRTSVQWDSRNDRAYAHDMTDDDHRRLAEVLGEVAGMVVLSGYPCELYDLELYPDWQRHEREHLADGGRPRTEVVWINETCAAAIETSRAQNLLFA